MPRAPALAGRAPPVFAGPRESARDSSGECAAPTLDRRTPAATGGGFVLAAAARAGVRRGAAEGVRAGAEKTGWEGGLAAGAPPATVNARAVPLPLEGATTAKP